MTAFHMLLAPVIDPKFAELTSDDCDNRWKSLESKMSQYFHMLNQILTNILNCSHTYGVFLPVLKSSSDLENERPCMSLLFEDFHGLYTEIILQLVFKLLSLDSS